MKCIIEYVCHDCLWSLIITFILWSRCSWITYFIHTLFMTPYLEKDYHMFIIRLILLLLHEDDGSKAGWNVNRLSVRGGNIYRGTLIGMCSSSSSCTLIHYFSFIFLLMLWSIIFYHFPPHAVIHSFSLDTLIHHLEGVIRGMSPPPLLFRCTLFCT